jgi:hypothetical protein
VVLGAKRPFGDDYNDGSNKESTLEAVEALQSLADFHEGRWKGKARSFTVTDDVDAGVVQRKASPEYVCFVKLGIDNKSNSKRDDLTLTESFQWDDNTKFSSRTVSLQTSRVDVDSVDASYSLDSSIRTAAPSLPSEIVGTDIAPLFMIEHCLAVSDNERARLFALYGDGSSSSSVHGGGDGDGGDSKGVNRSRLVRLIVLQETRVYNVEDDESPSSSLLKQLGDGSQSMGTSSLTAADLLEMESDIDRLVTKIAGQMPKAKNGKVVSSSEPQNRWKRLEQAAKSDDSSAGGAPPLARHDLSLLELSSGVWLGDVIIRDQKGRGAGGGSVGSKGFASRSSSLSSLPRFAEWELGVQKVAWRWMWNFGDEIRQVNNIGKAMGVALATNAIAASLSGFVAVNEGLSRRVPKSNRMVYIDWSGDNVGFLLDNVSIQVPRYLNFQDTSPGARRTLETQRPFYTEFGVYQNGKATDDENGLPEVVCSKISRVYDSQGQLRQGCTSFFTLKRFGVDGDQVDEI